MVYIESLYDLRRKYQHSYALYDNKITWFREFNLDPNNNFMFTTEGTQWKPYDAKLIQPILFDAMFVNQVNINKKKADGVAAILVSRLPKRQWRRGLCEDNTRVTTPAAQLYASLGKRLNWNHHINDNILEHVLKPQYPTFQEAIAACNSYITVAISPLFAVCLSTLAADKYLLASPFGFVGEASIDTIWVHHQPSWQEVKDYVKRTDQPITIHLET